VFLSILPARSCNFVAETWTTDFQHEPDPSPPQLLQASDFRFWDVNPNLGLTDFQDWQPGDSDWQSGTSPCGYIRSPPLQSLGHDTARRAMYLQVLLVQVFLSILPVRSCNFVVETWTTDFQHEPDSSPPQLLQPSDFCFWDFNPNLGLTDFQDWQPGDLAWQSGT
ncbi:unnamed protein product, partial [Ixodes persulcatus]